jgi:hypothetical protein
VGVQYRCGALKERITAELQAARDPAQRGDIMIAALYEMSRTVLPVLGAPKSGPEYLAAQTAVLELISFIAINLIRNCAPHSRGVAVLAEIGEGCHDPVLRKKFSTYSQELLAKSRTEQTTRERSGGGRRCPWFLGAGAATALTLYLVWPVPRPGQPVTAELPEASLTKSGETPLAYHAAAPPPEPVPEGTAPGHVRERAAATTPVLPQAADAKSASPGAMITRVRIANNQVLVPVTLRNGEEAIRVELVLDTGATRTSIHEGLIGRLKIDLRQAKLLQSEVADGRLIRSRSAAIDAMTVGPFTMSSPELNLISYQGSEGTHDGLLGMDFLAKHRYQIDMEHEQIRWF